MSKGSHRRPSSVDEETLDTNWKRAFSSKEKPVEGEHSCANACPNCACGVKQEPDHSNTADRM